MTRNMVAVLGAVLLTAACSEDDKSKVTADSGAQVDASVDAGPEPVQTDDTFIRDEQGRALVLRGVNVAHTAKRSVDGLPWVDRKAVLRLRQDFGLNVMRLTLFWNFVEPTRGKYDEAYLDNIEKILDWSEAADVHVVLDMHQDLFGFQATDSAEGDGIPVWARSTDCPEFTDAMPWFTNYFTPALQCQFTAFWANENDVQQALGATWKHIVTKLGAHPAVVGVDLFNEPWIPMSAESPAAVLTPFYDLLIPMMREGAPDMRVFYEPGTLTGSVTDQPVPKPDFPRLVYAPHFYPSDLVGSSSEYATNQASLDRLYKRHVAQANKAKVPLWEGEFGAAAEIPKIAQYYRDLNALWGPDFVGYARWSYDSTKTYDLAMLGDEGEELDHTTSMLEPYAERIPGTPKSTEVDMEKRTLKLSLDAERGGELVVSCPKRFCGNKRKVSLTSAGEALPAPESSYDAELGQLRVTLPKAKGLALTLDWGA